MIKLMVILSLLGILLIPVASVTVSNEQKSSIVHQVIAEALQGVDLSETTRTFFQQTGQSKAPGYGKCNPCKVGFGAAYTLLANGINYTDARDELINFCLHLENFTDWNPEILCQPMIDNYGPHVFRIIEIKNMTGIEVCSKLRLCPPESAPLNFPKSKNSLPQAQRPLEYEEKSHGQYSRQRHNQHIKKKGVQQESANISVVHFTDIHVDHGYKEGSATTACGLPKCCHSAWNGQGQAGYWGDHACNVPARTAELFFDAIAKMSPPPDLIIYTGDTPSHILWEETQWSQLNQTWWLTEALRKRFPNIPVFPAVGNHETFPSNMYYADLPEIKEMNRLFAEWWTDLAKFGSEQVATMTEASYFSLETRPGLWVIGYNSNYGYTDNWYNSVNDETVQWPQMMVYLEQQLSRIRVLDHKVILLAHHPIGTNPITEYYEEFFADLFRRYSDLIVLHVFGHIHSDHFRLILDQETGEAVSVQSVGTTMGSTENNPAARVFYLDATTFDLLDYDAYYLNLQQFPSHEPSVAVLTHQYRASSEYNMTALKPADWLDLTYKFETDWDLYNKYRHNNHAKMGVLGPCDDVCRWEDICLMRSATWPEHEQCLAMGPLKK